MSIQNITPLKIDFCDKSYVSVDAKQYDENSRFLLVSCYNQGQFFFVNNYGYVAYVRYKKADGYAVFNLCEITDEGQILVELTEQMLAASGICYADLIIVDSSAKVDVDTGEIVISGNSSVLSTMTFCINVIETPVENSEIESNYEFSAFNDALEKVGADCQSAVALAKEYADIAQEYYESIESDGAILNTDKATVNEVTTYLGIS